MTIKFGEMDACVQESMLRVIENKFNNCEVTAEESGNVVITALKAYQKLYDTQEQPADEK